MDGSDGWTWTGCSDWRDSNYDPTSLSAVINSIESEAEAGQALRWEIRIYPDGTTGLVGYQA